jgi:hypothetical protein
LGRLAQISARCASAITTSVDTDVEYFSNVNALRTTPGELGIDASTGQISDRIINPQGFSRA